jgi:hypothetical protein
MISKKEPIQNEREYLDRIPFVSELLKRIDDISQSIRHGYSGEDEAINLLTDLPDSWKTEIQKELDSIEKVYISNRRAINSKYQQGTSRSYKQELDNQRLEAGKDYSRNVKCIVINLLDSKGLLFLTRSQVPESNQFDIKDESTI